MIPQPRPYHGPQDLDAMRRILVAGQQDSGPAFYVHTGDLNWWIFYSETGADNEIWLWEEAETGGEAVAWALFSPFYTFDVFAHPGVTPEQRLAMFTWAEEQLAAEMRAQGAERMSTIWISEHDTAAVSHLTARGFQHADGDDLCTMACRLDDLDAAPALPPGFEIRPVTGEHEVEVRAAAQHAAFESSWDMARYLARYRRFMQSPVYDPERDLMAVAPDGQIAAFCIYWLDDVNRAGHLEPVGTHPAFHRRGLARAVVWEALRRMKAAGMETATVWPYLANQAAMGVYRSAGFEPVHDLWTFCKDLGG